MEFILSLLMKISISERESSNRGEESCKRSCIAESIVRGTEGINLILIVLMSNDIRLRSVRIQTDLDAEFIDWLYGWDYFIVLPSSFFHSKQGE